jgi:hypothetical protein
MGNDKIINGAVGIWEGLKASLVRWYYRAQGMIILSIVILSLVPEVLPDVVKFAQAILAAPAK